MSPRIALWTVLIAFTAVAGALGWSLVHDSLTQFRAGEPPPVADTKPDHPSLPPFRAADPSIGSSDPKAVQIVEFGDYRCLSCREAQAELNTALADFVGRVRFTWRDAPVGNTAEALLPARAARCAADQGKFWLMHDALFNNEKTLDLTTLESLAATAKLDARLFEACLAANTYTASLLDDLTLADQYGIRSVPTFFINGQAYEGLVRADEFRAILTNELKKP